ncbi:MAG: response regulator transcription factor [Pseudomonadota bacterium]
MTRVLIIEDDPEIASALARGLALHGYETGSENRSEGGLVQLQDGGFDAAIVDVMLGSDSGVELVRSAREAGVEMPIIMLSALSDVQHRAAGLEAGANDYVVKPFSLDELVARLRVQEQRVEASRPSPAVLTGKDRVLYNGHDSVVLTEREHDLLTLLITHAGTPLSRGAIFDALWQAEGSSSENVVDVYIGYLRKKLADTNFLFEIRTIRNKGFCLQGLPPLIRDAKTETKV